MSICMKCKTQTNNSGNSFLCSAVIDQKTQMTGKSSIMTTTYGKSVVHCVLCDSCIAGYVGRIRKAKASLFTPIFLMVVSALIGGLMLGAAQNPVIKILGLALIAVCWYFAIKDVIKKKRDANQRAKQMKDIDNLLLIRGMEREAEREYLKQTNATVTDVISGQ
ncbi:MAG: hypothetical protein ABFC62_11485 [Clostridiaceae bacterium]